MKTFVLVFIVNLIFFQSHGQYTMIPDSNFEQKLISLGHDSSLDGQVLTSNISGLTSIFLGWSDIQDLTGIEDFVSLQELRCNSNDLTSLDLSQNVNLIYIDCNSNDLTSIDLSQNVLVEHLNCSDNDLLNIDVSSLQNLDYFIVLRNQLQVGCLPAAWAGSRELK